MGQGEGLGSEPDMAPAQKAGAGEMTSEGAAEVGVGVFTAQMSSLSPSYLLYLPQEEGGSAQPGRGLGTDSFLI